MSADNGTCYRQVGDEWFWWPQSFSGDNPTDGYVKAHANRCASKAECVQAAVEYDEENWSEYGVQHWPSPEPTADELHSRIAELEVALEESVMLQSHYARLLNTYDGGLRMEFESAAGWIARLREVGKLTTPTDP